MLRRVNALTGSVVTGSVVTGSVVTGSVVKVSVVKVNGPLIVVVTSRVVTSQEGQEAISHEAMNEGAREKIEIVATVPKVVATVKRVLAEAVMWHNDRLKAAGQKVAAKDELPIAVNIAVIIVETEMDIVRLVLVIHEARVHRWLTEAKAADVVTHPDSPWDGTDAALGLEPADLKDGWGSAAHRVSNEAARGAMDIAALLAVIVGDREISEVLRWHSAVVDQSFEAECSVVRKA